MAVHRSASMLRGPQSDLAAYDGRFNADQTYLAPASILAPSARSPPG